MSFAARIGGGVSIIPGGQVWQLSMGVVRLAADHT